MKRLLSSLVFFVIAFAAWGQTIPRTEGNIQAIPARLKLRVGVNQWWLDASGNPYIINRTTATPVPTTTQMNAAMDGKLSLAVNLAAFVTSTEGQKQFDGSTWVRKSGTVTTATAGYPGVLLPGPSGFYYQRQYTGQVNVKWFGAVGDSLTNDTQAFQRAIDWFKTSGGTSEIYAPAGKYIITAKLVYSTKGYSPGLKLVGEGRERTVLYFNFNNGDPLIDIDGSSQQTYQYQFNGYITGLHITTNQSYAANSQGAAIRVNGWWSGTIANNVIKGLRGDGLSFPLRTDIHANTDAYQIALFKIDQNEISVLDGIGINARMGLAFSSVDITRNRIGICAKGGIVAGGHYVRIQNNTIFSNGKNDNVTFFPGIYIERQHGSTGNGLLIENNELDSNCDSHICLEGTVGGDIRNNRLLAWETVHANGRLNPTVAIRFKTGISGTKNSKIRFTTNTFRSQYIATGASSDWVPTWFDFGNDANNSDIVVDDWEVSSAPASVTDWANLNSNSRIKIFKANRLVNINQETPQFAGRITADLSIGTSAGGNLIYNSINNPQTYYNTTTGVFTAPYLGTYLVRFGLTLRGLEAGEKVTLVVKINGSADKNKVVYATGLGDEYFEFATSHFLSATSTISVHAYHGSASTTVIAVGGSTMASFNIQNVP